MAEFFGGDPGDLMDGLEGVHHQPVHLLLPLVHLHLSLLGKQLPHPLLEITKPTTSLFLPKMCTAQVELSKKYLSKGGINCRQVFSTTGVHVSGLVYNPSQLNHYVDTQPLYADPDPVLTKCGSRSCLLLRRIRIQLFQNAQKNKHRLFSS